MTDRELLEAAAKAADVEYGADRIDCGLSLTNKDGRHRTLPQWNPLTDDGDALRLVVALGIHLQFAMDFAVSYAGSVHAKQFSERNGSDPYAATRRAIVRAAAAIGASK